ncbi:MAG: hypothetical protein JWO19_3859 [Bryobacterales bacterium]|jgi:hypothetical protein|nr:hypothetical protein [Bryobacterales bacterium]
MRSDGQESSIDPTSKLDDELDDGVVAEKVFVERLEPQAQHSQEVLDEDDAFLALAGTEVWEYEVVNDRTDEFEDAIRNSRVVFEYTVVDESETPGDEATAVVLDRGDPFLTEDAAADTPTAAGSGVRATPDDGPAGQPTGDPSAGGAPLRRGRLADDQLEGIGEPGSGGLDELTITDADDPSLGLTGPETPGRDWAANTGPARTSVHGAQTRDLTDRGSALKPMDKSRTDEVANTPKKITKSNRPAGSPRKRKAG